MVQLPELKGLDLASAIQQFDRGRQVRDQRIAKRSLAEFGPAALQGDQNAINSLFASNPNAAIQFAQLGQQRANAAAANSRADRAFAFQQTESDRAQANADRAFKFEQTKFTQNQINKTRELNIALQAALKKDRPKPSDIAGLRKEFTTLSKEFIKSRDAFSRVKVAASAPDPQGSDDIALIFNFMKILDPGSVVRESEFATAENSGGVDEKIRTLYNKLLNGERLSSTQRSEFLNTSQRLFAQQERQQNKLFDTFEGLAERQGIDVNDVALDLGLVDPIDQLGAQQDPARRRFNPQTGTLDPVE